MNLKPPPKTSYCSLSHYPPAHAPESLRARIAISETTVPVDIEARSSRILEVVVPCHAIATSRYRRDLNARNPLAVHNHAHRDRLAFPTKDFRRLTGPGDGRSRADDNERQDRRSQAQSRAEGPHFPHSLMEYSPSYGAGGQTTIPNQFPGPHIFDPGVPSLSQGFASKPANAGQAIPHGGLSD